MSRYRVLTGLVLLMTICISTASFATVIADPPLDHRLDIPNGQASGSVERAAVHAVVVRSWGSASFNLVWEYLNQHWYRYGNTPISIDYTSLHNASNFTLADLEASGADVVIVSDPCGGTQQWSIGQAAALEAYAQAGHDVVGTYLLFQYLSYDNRMLAPIWGLRPDIDYNTDPLEADPAATVFAPGHCLFTAVEGDLDVGGWPWAQVPSDDLSWDADDLAGAELLARSADGRNVVTEYDGGTYRARYISYMPEYQRGGQTEATQWLYNAISGCPSISANLTCTPDTGTVPFSTRIRAILFNNTGWERTIAGRLDLVLGDGSELSGWRAGAYSIPASGRMLSSWEQWVPALPVLVGDNVLRLSGEDVTAPPYNQPPYPPSGETCTSTFTVTVAAP